MSIKILALSGMCILMTVMSIVMHISTAYRLPGQPAYKPASAVLLTEIGKLLCSLLLAYRECHQLILLERNISRRGGSNGEVLFSALPQDDNNIEMTPARSSMNGAHRFSKDGSSSDDFTRTHRHTSSKSPPPAASPANLPKSISTSGNTRPYEPQSRPTYSDVVQRMKTETFSGDWLKLSIPALLFTVQGNLAYYASSNLSVPVFQITYQLKVSAPAQADVLKLIKTPQIPATALCSVLMLNRVLTRLQWGSIALLSLGVGIVQLATQAVDNTARHAAPQLVKSDPLLPDTGHRVRSLASRALVTGSEVPMHQVLGLAAVVLACLSSGFSSVYFERVLKKPKPPPSENLEANGNSEAMTPMLNSNGQPVQQGTDPRQTGLWIRNIQLSLFSLIVGTVIYMGTSIDSLDNFFIGFRPIVWLVVALQIAGGLLAAVVIKYADNIAKSFSTSVSIILSFVASMILFDYSVTWGVVVGGAAVIGATWIFSEW